MKKNRWTLLICVLTLLAVCLTGCSSAKGYANESMDAVSPMAPMTEMDYEEYKTETSTSVSGSGLQYVTEDKMELQADAPTAQENGSGQAATPNLAQKLIYTVDLNVETLEYEKSLETIEQLTAEFGGYVEYAQVDNNRINSKWLRGANFTLRIPAAQLDAFLESCGSVGNVCSSTRRTENRTTEYADLSARLETLRIEEDTLQELLGKAEDLETIVSLNAYLSDVRYEIERVETNMRGIDGLVSYSTVNLYLEEVTVASDPVTPKSTFGERVSARLNDSWNDFRRGLERFGVFALGELPLLLLSCLLYLLPIIVVIIVIIVLIRRARKKRRMKKMMPPEASGEGVEPDNTNE